LEILERKGKRGKQGGKMGGRRKRGKENGKMWKKFKDKMGFPFSNDLSCGPALGNNTVANKAIIWL